MKTTKNSTNVQHHAGSPALKVLSALAIVATVLLTCAFAFAIGSVGVVNAAEIGEIPVSNDEMTEEMVDDLEVQTEEQVSVEIEQQWSNMLATTEQARLKADILEQQDKIEKEKAEEQAAKEAQEKQTAEAQQYETQYAVQPADNVQPVQASADSVSAAPAEPVYTPCTVNYAGISVPYVDSHLAARAPESTGGLWLGSDAVDDGTWGYFIGHNPGVFNWVMGLTEGDVVTICDSAGHVHSYTVVDDFTTPNGTWFENIESRCTGHGESIILQTCCGDNANVRIVIAQ